MSQNLAQWHFCELALDAFISKGFFHLPPPPTSPNEVPDQPLLPLLQTLPCTSSPCAEDEQQCQESIALKQGVCKYKRGLGSSFRLKSSEES